MPFIRRVLGKTRLIFPRINGPSDMPLKETKLYPKDFKKKSCAYHPPRNLLAARSKKPSVHHQRKEKRHLPTLSRKFFSHEKFL